MLCICKNAVGSKTFDLQAICRLHFLSHPEGAWGCSAFVKDEGAEPQRSHLSKKTSVLSAPQMTFSSSFVILAMHPVQTPPSSIDSGLFLSSFTGVGGDGNGGPLDQHLRATVKRPQLVGEKESEQITVPSQRRRWRLKYSPKG